MKIIITGVRGQDGKILRKQLLAEGHQVLGLDRPRADRTTIAATGITAVDLCDSHAVGGLFAQFQPDHFYHLAACHHSSETQGHAQFDREMVRTNFYAVETILAALHKYCPQCRLLLAGTSAMYRRVAGRSTVVDETTAMSPSTIYGRTKAWARDLLEHHRQNRGVFGGTAILFNHESPERDPSYISRKVSRAVARVAQGSPADLEVNDINAFVDWSSAQDVVQGMRLMIGAAEPRDFVFASGTERKVAELLEVAFRYVALDWQAHTRVKAAIVTSNSGSLVGNPHCAETVLGWRRQISFEQMIHEMVAHDQIELVRGLHRT